jgi:nicotinate-nucleotide adenylyltransferase
MEQKYLEDGRLKKRKNIYLLCGAFNPITLGHIKLAQFVLDSSRTFDEIWVTPCFKHMYNKDMASPYNRLEMCKLAAKADGRIKVFDYEIKNELGGETYHFVKNLLQEPFAKDEYNFSYIIGLDNANTFDKWVNYQDLERMIRFVVVSRQGVIRNEKVDWYLKQPHIFLQAENEIPEISSTQIRKWISEYREKPYVSEKDIVEYIGSEVFRYIMFNELYK